MKRYLILFLLGAAAHGPAQDDAASYFTKVDATLRLVKQAEWQYARATVRSRPKKVELERQELLSAISQASTDLSHLKEWNASSGLRDTAVAFLGVMLAVVNDDYGRVADLEPIAERAFDAMEAFIAARQAAETRYTRAAAALETEYHRFASGNGLLLTAEDAQKKPAASALQHYNDVYKVFFASYKQEAYLLDAIQAADVSAIDQNREALARCARTGLSRLDTMLPFDDGDLRVSCRKLLRFYQYEADEAMAEAALYFVQKADLDRQSLAVSNIRAGEKDPRIDAVYSEAKLTFRKRSENFERTGAVLARRRQSLLSAWQKSAEHFIRKHVR